MFGVDAYKRCKKCQERAKDWDDIFCRKCGGEIEQVRLAPHVGVSPSSGTYRITIVAEYDFRSDDHANEAAYKSRLGEEDVRFSELDARINYVKIKGPTKKSHPYKCKDCDSGEGHSYNCEGIWSDTTEGRCECCGCEEWVKR